jgi:8-oxo-dGTP diphosphatase
MDQKQKVVVVAVVYNSQNHVLISRRIDAYTPEAHDKWALIGGKVEYGEHPEDALRREVMEESGLEITAPKLLPKIFSQFWTNRHGEEYQVVLLPYRCTVVHETALELGRDPKIAELKFVHPSEIPSYEFLPLDVEMIAVAEQLTD